METLVKHATVLLSTEELNEPPVKLLRNVDGAEEQPNSPEEKRFQVSLGGRGQYLEWNVRGAHGPSRKKRKWIDLEQEVSASSPEVTLASGS